MYALIPQFSLCVIRLVTSSLMKYSSHSVLSDVPISSYLQDHFASLRCSILTTVYFATVSMSFITPVLFIRLPPPKGSVKAFENCNIMLKGMTPAKT